MRRASLGYIEFYRTALTVYSDFYKFFKIFADARKRAVSESVGKCLFGSLCDVSSVRGSDALRNGYDNIRLFAVFKQSVYIADEFILVKVSLRNINEIGTRSADISRKSACRGKPACVPAHYLDYRY